MTNAKTEDWYSRLPPSTTKHYQINGMEGPRNPIRQPALMESYFYTERATGARARGTRIQTRTHILQLAEGVLEPGLVVGGSSGHHILDSIFDDLLIPNVGLDQLPEAGHGLGLLVKLGREGNQWIAGDFL